MLLIYSNLNLSNQLPDKSASDYRDIPFELQK